MDSRVATVQAVVRAALVEDLGSADLSLEADVTSRLAVPAGIRGRARLFAKGRGVLAGADCAEVAFTILDRQCRVERSLADGAALSPGATVMEVDTGLFDIFDPVGTTVIEVGGDGTIAAIWRSATPTTDLALQAQPTR